jgi:hypothetical protein
MSKVEKTQAERNFVAHFGGCPQCGDNDGFINVGSSHWMLCKAHKVKWFVGANLFDSWKHQNEAEQRKAYDDLGFGEYRKLGDEETHSHCQVRQWERDLEKLMEKDGLALSDGVDLMEADEVPF